MKLSMNFVIIMILSLSIISVYHVIKSIYINEYIKQTEILASQYNKRSEFYIDNYESIAKSITENRIVRDVVSRNVNDYELNYVLTETMMGYSDVVCVSVYSKDYGFFSDKVIGSAPDLEFIKSKYFKDAKFEGDISWVIRVPESYSGYYDRMAYAQCVQGLYTCICKIRDDYGNVSGYLLLDTNISEFFKIYRNENTFEQQLDLYLKKADFVIGDKDNVNNTSEVAKISERSGKKTIVSNKTIYVFYPLASSANQFVIGVSMNKIYTVLHLILAVMIFIGIIFYIGSICVINRFVGGIINTAGKINDKISNYNIDEK